MTATVIRARRYDTGEPVQVIQLLDALKQSVAQAQGVAATVKSSGDGPRRRRSA